MKKLIVFVVSMLLVVVGVTSGSKIKAEENDRAILACDEFAEKKQTSFGGPEDNRYVTVSINDPYWFNASDIEDDWDTITPNFKVFNGTEDITSSLGLNFILRYANENYLQIKINGNVTNPVDATIKFIFPYEYIDDDYDGEEDYEATCRFVIYDTDSKAVYNENYNRTYDIGDELDINSQNNIFRINAVNDNFIPNDLNEGDTLLTLHGLDLKVKDFDRYDHGSLIQWIDVYFDGTVEDECEDEQVNLVLDKGLFNFSSNNLTVDGEFKLTIVDPDKDDDPPAEEPPVEEPTQEPEVVIEKEIVYVYETIIKYVEVPTVVPKMGVER